jgi:hypothetical protein
MISGIVGSKVVDAMQAREFIATANQIVQFVRSAIPEELHWPEYEFQFKVSFEKTLKRQVDGENSGPTQ